MTVVELLALAVLATGSVLVLSEVPWFRDRPLRERLRPYVPGGPVRSRAVSRNVFDLSAVLGPLASELGNHLSRAMGVRTDLSARLDRAGRTTDAEEFRLRQLAHALVSLLLAGAAAMAVQPDPALAAALVIGAPALVALGHEQALSRAIELRRRRLKAELPVLAEQLGLLVAAGYSVTGAMARLAERSNGVAADDLQHVLLRMRRGESEHAALAEWAERSDLDAVGRLTAVLALHGETGDLGRLVGEEARSMRAEAHRDLLEAIERRAQLVWIPVTVATLVPGLVFLAVPFMSAMSQVTGGA